MLKSKYLKFTLINLSIYKTEFVGKQTYNWLNFDTIFALNMILSAK